MTSATSAWAVGYDGNVITIADRTLILHWNGTQWKQVASVSPAGGAGVSQLYGVAGYDVLALATATVVLALCATAAGFLPARRAASIEPMEALRTE